MIDCVTYRVRCHHYDELIRLNDQLHNEEIELTQVVVKKKDKE